MKRKLKPHPHLLSVRAPEPKGGYAFIGEEAWARCRKGSPFAGLRAMSGVWKPPGSRLPRLDTQGRWCYASDSDTQTFRTPWRALKARTSFNFPLF